MSGFSPFSAGRQMVVWVSAGCCRISAIGARALAGAEWGRSCRAREKATLQMGNCVGHTTPGLSGLRCFNFNEPSLSDWLTFLFRQAANDWLVVPVKGY